MSDDRDLIRGECIQLLRPDEVDGYAVGGIGSLFGAHGWSVAVISAQPHDPSLGDVITDFLRRWLPFSKPGYIYNVLVRESEFREGDTVRLRCGNLDEHWYCHPFNPVAHHHRVALERHYAEQHAKMIKEWNDSIHELEEDNA